MTHNARGGQLGFAASRLTWLWQLRFPHACGWQLRMTETVGMVRRDPFSCRVPFAHALLFSILAFVTDPDALPNGQPYMLLTSRPGSEWFKDTETRRDLRSQRLCDWCGSMRRGPSARRCRVCEDCRSAYYCCTDCQRSAWKGGHWAACGPATKMRCSDLARDHVTEDVA